MKEQYLRYLPNLMEDMEEFQVLALAEGVILKEEEEATTRMEQEQWIQTATIKGLERRENMMRISAREGETLSEKRQRILYHWNQHGPYTYGTLVQWLEGFCGGKQYVIGLDDATYTLRVVLRLSIKELQSEVLWNLRKMIPANLVLEVLLDYNTYQKLKLLTHGGFKQFHVQYSEMKEVDFFKDTKDA